MEYEQYQSEVYLDILSYEHEFMDVGQGPQPPRVPHLGPSGVAVNLRGSKREQQFESLAPTLPEVRTTHGLARQMNQGICLSALFYTLDVGILCS